MPRVAAAASVAHHIAAGSSAVFISIFFFPDVGRLPTYVYPQLYMLRYVMSNMMIVF